MTDIALALGGGGIKGLAHLGVIRALEKAGFTIKAITGTSAGAIAGSAYAAGFTTEQMETKLSELNPNSLFGHASGEGPSLLGLAGVTNLLQHYLGNVSIEDLKIPFACTAVDIKLSREFVFTKGPVIDAVLSSIAFPGIFPPHDYKNHQFIDGGVLDPVPIILARHLNPSLPILAVALNPTPDHWAELPDTRIPGPTQLLEAVSHLRIAQAFQIFTRSMDISARMLTEVRLKSDHPDFVIRPDVSQFGILDEVNPHLLIRLGEQSVERVLPEIRNALQWDNRLTNFLAVKLSPKMDCYEP